MRSRPTPWAPWRTGDLDFLRQVDVALQRDFRAVGRDRRLAGDALELQLQAMTPNRLQAGGLQLVRRRVQQDPAGLPVEQNDGSLGMRSSAPGTPMTAGMPSECARIAACDVRVPSSLISPAT